MPCSWFKMPDGTQMHVRYSHPPRRRCKWCTRWSTRLCDGPPRRKGRETCDQAMCDAHARSIGPDKDLCPDCLNEQAMPPNIIPTQGSLPL